MTRRSKRQPWQQTSLTTLRDVYRDLGVDYGNDTVFDEVSSSFHGVSDRCRDWEFVKCVCPPTDGEIQEFMDREVRPLPEIQMLSETCRLQIKKQHQLASNSDIDGWFNKVLHRAVKLKVKSLRHKHKDRPPCVERGEHPHPSPSPIAMDTRAAQVSRTKSTSPQLAAHRGQGTQISIPNDVLMSILDSWYQSSLIQIDDVVKWVVEKCEETGLPNPFRLLPPGTDGEIVHLSASIRSEPVDDSQRLEGALPVVLFDYDPVVPNTVWGGLKEQADEENLDWSGWNLALPEPKSLIWGTECE